MDGKKYAPPSAGMLGWNRGTSSDALSFFGSRVKSREIITITLCSGENDRSLAGDSYFAKNTLFEVDMTPIQWAEFITTPNRGSGVPCTMSYTREGKLQKHERPETETESEVMENEYRDVLEELRDTLTLMENSTVALEKGRGVLTVEARKRITDNMRRAYNLLTDSLPFLAKRFASNMEATVVECKSSVDAYVTRLVHETGLEQLQGEVEKRTPMITKQEPDE